jgi:hypothetical protein
MLQSNPIEFIDITPNPTTGDVDAFIRHALGVGTSVDVLLTDLVGKTVWRTAAAVMTSPEAHLRISLPSWVPEGAYLLRLGPRATRLLEKSLFSAKFRARILF